VTVGGRTVAPAARGAHLFYMPDASFTNTKICILLLFNGNQKQ